jgi:hypothetical protein
MSSLAEDDQVLKEEDVTCALLASLIHYKLILPEKHALLLQIHLHSAHTSVVTRMEVKYSHFATTII